MRVAIVTPVFPSDLDLSARGVGVGAVVLARALLAQRPDLDLHVLHYKAPHTLPPAITDDPPFTVHRLRGSRAARASLSVGPAQAEVSRVLARIQPDVVHVRGTASFVDGQRWPSVLSVHGITEHEAWHSGMRAARMRAGFHWLREPAARRRYRHIIAIAGFVLRQLGAQLRGRVHFIPNPIDSRFFDAADERRSTEPVVVHVGDICPIKNQIASVQAMALLARRGVDAHLRIVGQVTYPGYGAQLREQIRTLGLTDRVELVGRVTRSAMPAQLASARVLVLPSLIEVAPLVISEASAMGLPSVASPVGGSAELVIQGVTGRLVQARSPQSIADGLHPFLEDAALAARFGQAARGVAQRHRPSAVARSTLSVYQTIVDG